MNWAKEDILMVEKFIEIKNKGLYADGAQLTEVYNRVLDKRVNTTNCGSCIRQRIKELEDALNYFKRMSQKQQINASGDVETEEVDTLPTEEKTTQPEQKKRVGRPKKK